MKIRRYASWMCRLASAALLHPPGANVLADTGRPVTCKDGTTSPHGRRRSCSGHGGINKAATAAAAGGSSVAAVLRQEVRRQRQHRRRKDRGNPTPPAAARAAAPAPPARPAVGLESTTRKPGGGSRRWTGHGVGDSASKVYHCPSDRWYGKTKAGEYMTEADTKAKGDRRSQQALLMRLFVARDIRTGSRNSDRRQLGLRRCARPVAHRSAAACAIRPTLETCSGFGRNSSQPRLKVPLLLAVPHVS